MDVRCPNKLHGRLDDGVLEVRCKSGFCGAVRGVVVVHRFDIASGELVETRLFAEPVKKGVEHGSSKPGSSVRSA